MHVLRKSLISLSLLSLAPLSVAVPAEASQRQYALAATAADGTGGTGGTSCVSPVWTSSTSGDLYTGDSPYLVHNNMWNAEGYDVSQTMSVCDHTSWYVDDTVPAGTDSAVKTFPNVHVDYHNWSTGYEPALSSFNRIMSSYAGQGAGIGVYDVAYDIWLNGVASAGSNEVMIWTENKGQTPAGSLIASNVTMSDKSWNVWATSSNGYIAFVPTRGRSYQSGTLNLKAFFTYLVHEGRIPSTSTLGQIDYGVEVVSTDGRTARFTCTNFSLSTRIGEVP
jgi:hypothetical protein